MEIGKILKDFCENVQKIVKNRKKGLTRHAMRGILKTVKEMSTTPQKHTGGKEMAQYDMTQQINKIAEIENKEVEQVAKELKIDTFLNEKWIA